MASRAPSDAVGRRGPRSGPRPVARPLAGFSSEGTLRARARTIAVLGVPASSLRGLSPASHATVPTRCRIPGQMGMAMATRRRDDRLRRREFIGGLLLGITMRQAHAQRPAKVNRIAKAPAAASGIRNAGSPVRDRFSSLAI